MDLQKIFSEVPDFRINRRKLHLLSDILVISLCGVISGANDFEDIAEYGRQKQAFLSKFLVLPNGIPSHDTFNRVFRHLDTQSFNNCLVKWSSEILSCLDFYQVNIDGKVLRATAKSGEKKSGLCLVSAWVSEQNVSLGQLKTSVKSNEKTAIPELISNLDIKNALVSIDAIACSKSVASQIIEKEADYLLALKNNNKGLYEQVSHWMKSRKSYFDVEKHIDFGSGRIEHRNCYVCQELSFLEDLADWKGIASVIMIEASQEKNGVISNETRFYLSSKSENASFFNKAVRNHWKIESTLHWQLDIAFLEDRQRVQMNNAAENMSTLRKMSLQLILKNKTNKSVKTTRNKAAWNNDVLISILKNIPHI
jgi:predicted transposase YbfD/YdcC